MSRPLYQNLLNLVKSNEAFYYKDFTLDDELYRIFSYRLAQYSDFKELDALECRGVMFRIYQNGDYHSLVSRPFEKFFNLNENPFTMDLNLNDNNIKQIMTKEDGSLISTFIHKGQLRFKSKTSLSSSQAVDAMNYINRPEHYKFKCELEKVVISGYTVNLEYTSPDNQIVLLYPKSNLTVLGIRHNDIGQYWELDDIQTFGFEEISKRWVAQLPITIGISKFLDDCIKEENIEGYVVELKNNLKFKIKTDWYLARHRARDSINTKKGIFESVLNESIDDIKAMFSQSVEIINKIEHIETLTKNFYNHSINTIETFYNNNKDLSRKDYAIKGRAEIDDMLFPLTMNLYLGKTNNYVEYFIKQQKYLTFLREDSLVEE